MRIIAKIMVFYSLLLLNLFVFTNNSFAESPKSHYIVVSEKRISKLARDSDEWWHIMTHFTSSGTNETLYSAKRECENISHRNFDGKSRRYDGIIYLQRKFETDSEMQRVINILNQGRWDVNCGKPRGFFYARKLVCIKSPIGQMSDRITCGHYRPCTRLSCEG
jgi:hypothetical protein